MIENEDTAQHAITANSSTVFVFVFLLFCFVFLSKGARKQDTHTSTKEHSQVWPKELTLRTTARHSMRLQPTAPFFYFFYT